jgi:hypothetical protein
MEAEGGKGSTDKITKLQKLSTYSVVELTEVVKYLWF